MHKSSFLKVAMSNASLRPNCEPQVKALSNTTDEKKTQAVKACAGHLFTTVDIHNPSF